MSISSHLLLPAWQAYRRLAVFDKRFVDKAVAFPGARTLAERDQAAAQLMGYSSDKLWLARHALSPALDRRDDWLTVTGRSAELAAEVEVSGQWPDQPFIALGTHWGAGLPTLAHLSIRGRCPIFVYRQEPASVFKTRAERWAQGLHLRALNMLGGVITLGGASVQIMAALEKQATPVVLVDAPAEGRPTLLGRAAGFELAVRQGLLSMLTRERIPYVLYRCGFDPMSGQRKLSIAPSVVPEDPQQIADHAAGWLENALKVDSAQWRLWMVSEGLLKAKT